jgi:hypothetical protein
MIIRGIFEVKHGTDIPGEALRQGASEHQMLPRSIKCYLGASNVAFMYVESGVNGSCRRS